MRNRNVSDPGDHPRQGDCWTYNTQGPEPNPEVLSYIGSWPYFSWPGYVRWWHLGGWC